MKKSTRISLIVSAALIAAGCCLSGAAIAAVDGDLSKLNSASYTEKQYDFTEDIESVRIEARCDVRIQPSADGVCHVSVFDEDSGDIFYEIKTENGVLNISRKDRRKWYERIEISFSESKDTGVTVSLPEERYIKLFAETAAGDISVSDGLVFDEGELSTASGDIDLAADVSSTLKVETVSGDIKISGVGGEELSAKTTSGDIKLKNLTAGHVQAKAVSGDAEISGCSGKELSVKTTSGDIELKNTISEMLSLQSVSGDVGFFSCDGKDISVKTTSGDVGGNLLSGKDFSVSTTSGDVSLPNSQPDGDCSIATVSGDVNIYV